MQNYLLTLILTRILLLLSHTTATTHSYYYLLLLLHPFMNPNPNPFPCKIPLSREEGGNTEILAYWGKVLRRENPEVQVLENYNVLGGSEGSGRIP